MPLRRLKFGCGCVLVLLAAAVAARSQQAKRAGGSDSDQRAVLERVPPAYPDLARRLNIQGKVKLQVVVSPSGKVKATRAIGGNPVLAQAASDAVAKWKYEPARAETTNLVELDFHHP